MRAAGRRTVRPSPSKIKTTTKRKTNMSLYILSVWLHVLLACIWVGGMIYTAAVVIPFAVKQSPDERQRIIRGQARKFRMIGWTSVVLLVITGVYNATQRFALDGIGGLFDK